MGAGCLRKRQLLSLLIEVELERLADQRRPFDDVVKALRVDYIDVFSLDKVDTIVVTRTFLKTSIVWILNLTRDVKIASESKWVWKPNTLRVQVQSIRWKPAIFDISDDRRTQLLSALHA